MAKTELTIDLRCLHVNEAMKEIGQLKRSLDAIEKQLARIVEKARAARRTLA